MLETRTGHRDPTSPAIWFLLLLVAGLLIYFRSLFILPYDDDFVLLGLTHDWSPLAQFARTWPYAFYRPLPAVIVGELLHLTGPSMLPIHLLNIFFHAWVCLLVYLIAIHITDSPSHARVASIVMLASQANSYVVMSDDTTAQLMSTGFGCWAILNAVRLPPASVTRATFAASLHRNAPLALTVLAYGLALLSKESGVFFLIPVIVLLSRQLHRREPAAASRTSILIAGALLILITGAYVLLRESVGALGVHPGSSGYEVALGMRTVRSLGLLAIGMITPLSTVVSYVLAKTGAWGILIAFGAAASASTVLLAGTCLARSTKQVLFVLFLCFLLVSPFALLPHVSEGYLYNGMPMFSIVVSIGIMGVLRSSGVRRATRVPVMAVLGLFLLGHLQGQISKASLMVSNGREASRLIVKLRPMMIDLPSGAAVILCHVASSGPVYSAFLRDGFLLLANNEEVGWLVDRPDLRINVIAGCTTPCSCDSDAAFVVYDDDPMLRLIRPIPPARTPSGLGFDVEARGCDHPDRPILRGYPTPRNR